LLVVMLSNFSTYHKYSDLAIQLFQQTVNKQVFDLLSLLTCCSNIRFNLFEVVTMLATFGRNGV